MSEWSTRQSMPIPGSLFLAAWCDDERIDQVELLVATKHDGKWLNQNTGNFIADSWNYWMPVPERPRS